MGWAHDQLHNSNQFDLARCSRPEFHDVQRSKGCDSASERLGALGAWGATPWKRSETPGGLPERSTIATPKLWTVAPCPAYACHGCHFAHRVAACQ